MKSKYRGATLGPVNDISKSIATGRLICVVGPSGAGKDSVIGYARDHLPPGSPVVFARRTITRPAESGGEDHEAVSEQDFARLLREEEFALHWHANGLSYGIRKELYAWLEAGMTVVMSGSRQHLPDLLAGFPRAEIVHIVAPLQVLRKRLSQRGRERPEQIERRLQRALLFGEPRPGERTIANSGVLATAGEALLSVIAAATPSTALRDDILCQMRQDN